MHTTAFWLHFPETFLARFPDLSATEKQNAIDGLANVLRTVAAVLLMCDPRDLGIAIAGDISNQTARFEPDLFLYDKYPGGIGQSQPLFQLRTKLLAGARERVEILLLRSGMSQLAWGRWAKLGKGQAGRFASARRASGALTHELVAFQRGYDSGLSGMPHYFAETVQTDLFVRSGRGRKGDDVFHGLADSQVVSGSLKEHPHGA